ncbi:helix-turn-helix transcriptional regulator [Actinoplanes sp. TRM 88003]|uniref:Helix-turn-helix transcriptional regulator n=1 Tax=Paractinoplanes aksuensis TaxID=2939490 RepID=A0ABT1DRU5_9ACTN|nr:helix-turn-helix transcriptional regulator [Actinoplanes aksuensis]MCO8273238.1 helix-turn-helix transcriptional regulator [Actinoplanes aksuensis]
MSTLAERLRELRGQLTQLALGRVLGVSVPLISSWERGAVPPPERLNDYARYFAQAKPGPKLPRLGELSGDEHQAYEKLRRDLNRLRGSVEDEPEVPHPLRFPPGQAITIVSSELPGFIREQFGDVSKPQGPDYVDAYKYADLDALIELLSFVRGMNPSNPTLVGVPRELSTDDLTAAHLIVLGGVDFNEVTEAVMDDLSHVPVKQLRRATFQDTGAFSVAWADGRRSEFVPKLLPDQHGTSLREDVAQYLRAPNPYNRERTLSFFNGMYSRGSYGVVRALTDPEIHRRNATYVDRRFRGADTYSIVCRVKIVANEVVVPDWTVDDIRLHEWPEVERDRSGGAAIQ